MESCDVVPATQLAIGPGRPGRAGLLEPAVAAPVMARSTLRATLSSLSGPFRALRVWREGAALAPALLALGALGGTLALFAVLASVEGSWRGWDPAACLRLPRGCFCERPLEGSLVKQPANTFSNLAFSLTGCVVLLEAGAQHERLREQRREQRRARASEEEALALAFTVVFGLANLALGLGSGLFHASLALPFEVFDNVAMYMIVGAPLLYAAAELRLARRAARRAAPPTRHAARFVAQYVLLVALCALPSALAPDSRLRHAVFPALLAATLFAELAARSAVPRRAVLADARALVGAALSFSISFFLWTLDRQGVVCDPDDHVVQLHSAWHLGTALASLQLLLYYHPLLFGRPKGPAPQGAPWIII